MGGEDAAFPLSCIQVAVADLDTTEAFYAGALGLPARRAFSYAGAPEHLVLEMEGWRVIFAEEERVLQGHPFLEEALSGRRGGGISFHYNVCGIEEIFDALLEEEIEIVYPLREHPYGMKDVWCYDPDGYLVVLEEKIRRDEYRG